MSVSTEQITALVRRITQIGYYERHQSKIAKVSPDAIRRQKNEYKMLFQVAGELPIVQPKGGTTTLHRLVAALKEAVPDEVLSCLTVDNVFSVSPFAELGQIRVGTTREEASGPHAVTLRQLLHPWGERGVSGFPLLHEGQNVHSHTIWLNAQWSWFWIPLIIAQFSASTSVSADGLDAAFARGGDYAAAARLCQTPLSPEERNSIVGIIQAFACQYAMSAPSTPLNAYEIVSTACNCSACSANETVCDFSDAKDCTTRSASNVSSISAVHTDWLLDLTCLNVASLHSVTLHEGDQPFVYVHTPG